MGRLLYLLCEAFALYVIGAAVVIGFLFFAGFHFDSGLLSYAVVGLLIAMAPMSYTAASRGTWVGEGLVDRRAPVRPLAMVAPAAATLLRSSEWPVVGGRQSFQLLYSGPDEIESIDVADRLARNLADAGIAHSYLGAIHAHEGLAEWRLEPVLGERRLEGWVEAVEQRDRVAVIVAITDFLKQDLRLDVEVTR